MSVVLRMAAVSVGGVLGVNARYWLGVLVAKLAPDAHFPWATLLINVSGCFAIGLLAAGMERWFPNPLVRLGVFVGFLGGYTTFSTFGYESVLLYDRGKAAAAVLNVAASVLVGIAAVKAGSILGHRLIAE